jgi:hypothetical protein
MFGIPNLNINSINRLQCSTRSASTKFIERVMGKKTKRINQFVKLQQQKSTVARQLRHLLCQNQALRQREQVQWRIVINI